MAYSARSFSMILFITLILFISISSSSADDDDHKNLKDLCAKTRDKWWCVDTLRRDTRSRNANYRRLTEIAIELAYNRSKDIHEDYNKLSSNTTDSKLKEHYESCSKNYNDVVRDLEQAKNLFSKSDYNRVRVQVKDAAQEANACKDEFEKSWRGFQKENRQFVILINVVRVFVEEVIARKW